MRNFRTPSGIPGVLSTPGTPILSSYDLILINTSGGKDSATMADLVAREAKRAGVLDRCLLVHATFPEEWDGTVDLVKRQARALGVSLEVVTRGEGLLDYALRRGRWPSNQQRWCTSDFKRAPIDKVITRRAPWYPTPDGMRRARVLNCMGFRAGESPARAKRVPFELDKRRTNGRRHVDQWLPIFDLSEAMVWQYVESHELEMHPAYKAGMPRLSCVFCIFAPRAALVRAGQLAPDLLDKYVEVEAKIGHQFRGAPGSKGGISMAEVKRAVQSGETVEGIESWTM